MVGHTVSSVWKILSSIWKALFFSKNSRFKGIRMFIYVTKSDQAHSIFSCLSSYHVCRIVLLFLKCVRKVAITNFENQEAFCSVKILLFNMNINLHPRHLDRSLLCQKFQKYVIPKEGGHSKAHLGVQTKDVQLITQSLH